MGLIRLLSSYFASLAKYSFQVAPSNVGTCTSHSKARHYHTATLDLLDPAPPLATVVAVRQAGVLGGEPSVSGR